MIYDHSARHAVAAPECAGRVPCMASTWGRSRLPMAVKSPFDTEVVRELAKLIAETDLSEIEVEKGDLKIRVARQITAHVAVSAAGLFRPARPGGAPAAVEPRDPAAPGAANEPHPGAVRSPMVGTAYRRPSPDAKPFVEIGSVVKAGEKVLLIEAMKTFNEIVARAPAR
jgi:acetyl-CoA carboxylase biotin carboxyl carrier protein